jgi:hypothetical protein
VGASGAWADRRLGRRALLGLAPFSLEGEGLGMRGLVTRFGFAGCAAPVAAGGGNRG